MAEQDGKTGWQSRWSKMHAHNGLLTRAAWRLGSPCAHDQARMRSGVKMRSNAVAFTGSQADCMTLSPVYSIVAQVLYCNSNKHTMAEIQKTLILNLHNAVAWEQNV